MKRILAIGAAAVLAACASDRALPSAPVAEPGGEPSTSVGPIAHVSVTCFPSAVHVGGGGSCTATARDAANQWIPTAFFLWGSSAPAKVTVTGAGVFTAHSPGTALVWASAGGVSGSAAVTVLAPPVATTVELTPSAPRAAIGSTVALAATVRDQYGASMAQPVVWTSESPGVASVSSTGVMSALAAGVATIRATAGAATATVAVVSHPTLATSGPEHASDEMTTVTVSASPSGTYHYTWRMATCQIGGSCSSTYDFLQDGTTATSASRFVSIHDAFLRYRIDVRAVAGGPILESIWHFIDGDAVPPTGGGCGFRC